MNPFGSLLDWVGLPFQAAAGWAWDTVVNGITHWLATGAVTLLLAIWDVLDTVTTPHLGAEWFSGRDRSPVQVAFTIGIPMTAALLLVSIGQAVIHRSPGTIARRVVVDLSGTVLAMVSAVPVTQVLVNVFDGVSDSIWAQTRPSAVDAVDLLGIKLASLPGVTFLGPLLALTLLLAVLFLWIVLFLRESLIYTLVVLAVAFGFPSWMWPPLRQTATKLLELIGALIISKTVIVLTLAVGISALGGVGATGQPGDPVAANAAAEYGTLVVGIIIFGLAAFMPYLVYRLLPLAAGAAIAGGIASGPLRAATQAMQFQHYSSATMSRLTGPASGGAASAAGPVGAAVGAGAAVASTAARAATATVAANVPTASGGASTAPTPPTQTAGPGGAAPAPTPTSPSGGGGGTAPRATTVRVVGRAAPPTSSSGGVVGTGSGKGRP